MYLAKKQIFNRTQVVGLPAPAEVLPGAFLVGRDSFQHKFENLPANTREALEILGGHVFQFIILNT